jgi:XRE family transcriptional regulator, regulator of sulfur utilization
MITMSPIRLRVKELRDVKGWTQEQLAEHAGLTRATVNRIERGQIERVEFKTLEALADALGVEPGYLIERSGKPKRR